MIRDDYEDGPYEEHMPDPQFERGGDYVGEFDYLKEEEPYKPTPSDLALFASLKATEVAGVIMQAHVDGCFDLDTYNKLYKVAKEVQTAIEALRKRLEEE